jgi:hypothetical protein
LPLWLDAGENRAVVGQDRRRDREVIVDLSGLLPPESRTVPVELWDPGEEGLAVETPADLLSDHHLPLRPADRLRLLATADRWAVGQRVRGALRWCPDPDADDRPWTVIEGSGRAELGRAFGEAPADVRNASGGCRSVNWVPPRSGSGGHSGCPPCSRPVVAGRRCAQPLDVDRSLLRYAAHWDPYAG